MYSASRLCIRASLSMLLARSAIPKTPTSCRAVHDSVVTEKVKQGFEHESWLAGVTLPIDNNNIGAI